MPHPEVIAAPPEMGGRRPVMLRALHPSMHREEVSMVVVAWGLTVAVGVMLILPQLPPLLDRLASASLRLARWADRMAARAEEARRRFEE